MAKYILSSSTTQHEMNSQSNDKPGSDALDHQMPRCQEKTPASCLTLENFLNVQSPRERELLHFFTINVHRGQIEKNH